MRYQQRRDHRTAYFGHWLGCRGQKNLKIQGPSRKPLPIIGPLSVWAHNAAAMIFFRSHRLAVEASNMRAFLHAAEACATGRLHLRQPSCVIHSNGKTPGAVFAAQPRAAISHSFVGGSSLPIAASPKAAVTVGCAPLMNPMSQTPRKVRQHRFAPFSSRFARLRTASGGEKHVIPGC